MLLIFYSINSISQVSQEWVSSYHFTSDDGKALTIDDNGNVYVTGTSGNDYATIKYNSSGVQQWVAKYDGPANGGDGATAIAVDASGNVYVTGGSNGISSGSDFATVKYNSSGVQQWVARLSGTGNNVDLANAIAVDSSGNVYVTGFTFGSGSFQNYTTVKYNSSGNLQWVKYYNGTGNNADFASALALDDLGNVYVTGYSRGSGSSDDDFATIKYNSAGNEEWVRIYQGPGDEFDQAQSIAVDGLSNVYVTGRSFGAGTNYDYATIKYNSLGDSLWVQRYNGVDNNHDFSKTVKVDASGNVFVLGQSFNNLTNYDFATVKYNSAGVFQWDKKYNGPGNSVENANAMALDDSGNVYITGSSSLSGQNYNYATVKYSNSGIERWSQIYNGTASGSDEPFSIAVDASGNVYVTGSSAGLGQMKNYVTIKYSQSPRATLTAFIEGFYNSSSNSLNSDIVKIYLRNTSSPFSIVDTSVSTLDSVGTGTFYFSNISNGTNYYIIIKHRNSIETWSNSGNSFASDTLIYDFTTAANKAFGNNMKQVDTSPVRFAIYSGDVNQDGVVDATDAGAIDNDASNFVTGYVNTDITGDDLVDATDAAIADNNASNFVSVIRP